MEVIVLLLIVGVLVALYLVAKNNRMAECANKAHLINAKYNTDYSWQDIFYNEDFVMASLPRERHPPPPQGRSGERRIDELC